MEVRLNNLKQQYQTLISKREKDLTKTELIERFLDFSLLGGYHDSLILAEKYNKIAIEYVEKDLVVNDVKYQGLENDNKFIETANIEVKEFEVKHSKKIKYIKNISYTIIMILFCCLLLYISRIKNNNIKQIEVEIQQVQTNK
jgi:hypothetical protein